MRAAKTPAQAELQRAFDARDAGLLLAALEAGGWEGALVTVASPPSRWTPLAAAVVARWIDGYDLVRARLPTARVRQSGTLLLPLCTDLHVLRHATYAVIEASRNALFAAENSHPDYRAQALALPLIFTAYSAEDIRMLLAIGERPVELEHESPLSRAAPRDDDSMRLLLAAGAPACSGKADHAMVVAAFEGNARGLRALDAYGHRPSQNNLDHAYEHAVAAEQKECAAWLRGLGARGPKRRRSS